MSLLCSRIRNLRLENHLTQQELADHLGTTQQVYSRYETGMSEVPLRCLEMLADFYQVQADYLLGRTEIRSYRLISSDPLDENNSIDTILSRRPLQTP